MSFNFFKHSASKLRNLKRLYFVFVYFICPLICITKITIYEQNLKELYDSDVKSHIICVRLFLFASVVHVNSKNVVKVKLL